MKKILALIIFLSSFYIVKTQHLEVPALSPLCKVEQMVGLTKIELEYSRPSAKGRVIFGDLVPYGELWRTGANLNTTISFSKKVKIGQQEVDKGSYAIITIPAKNADWDVIIYDAPRGYTPQELDQSKVVSRFKAKATLNSNSVETFSIEFADFKTSSANLLIKWANLILHIPIDVNADELAMKNIDSVVNGPSADDLYNAAEYYFFNDKDLAQALKWTREAGVKYGWDAYWPHYLEARILAKQNKSAEAIQAATRAEGYVRKAGYIVTADQIAQQIVEWKTK